jgi:chemotaxis protein MotB
MAGHKHHHEEEEKENEERWLLTYADLITLLMAFFVVMYAMSKVDKDKFKSISMSLSTAFSNPSLSPIELPMERTIDGQRTVIIPTPPKTDNTERRRQRAEKLKSQFEEMFKLQGLENDVTVKVSPDARNIMVRLPASLLFKPGSGVMERESEALVDKISSVVLKARKPVRIEGHTDNIPINNAQFQSNWQLSAVRAANVLMYMEQKYKLDPQLLSASGYGEYRPIAPNDTPDNRAKNRRVEFVIQDSIGEEDE